MKTYFMNTLLTLPFGQTLQIFISPFSIMTQLFKCKDLNLTIIEIIIRYDEAVSLNGTSPELWNLYITFILQYYGDNNNKAIE